MAITTTPSGGPQGEFSTYTPIYSQTLSSNTTSVTFSNIPTTFTDLRVVMVPASSSGTNGIRMRVGSGSLDTDSNYSNTFVDGNGSTALSYRESSGTQFVLAYRLGITTTLVQNYTIDFLNYSNTTTRKTILVRYNSASAASGAGVLLWRNTGPINTLSFNINTFGSSTGDFIIGSTFTLYGIKAATTAPKATGGDTVTTDGSYWYHAFKTTGVFDAKQALTADIMVVAGGGGGGQYAPGGGGAGGFQLLTSQSLTAVKSVVTVGGGGVYGFPSDSGGSGYQGSNSQFGSLTASVGGGFGRGANSSAGAGGNGGSGGGAGGTSGSASGGSPTAGQGNSGGSVSSANYSGAGGGGAGAAGGNNSGPTGGVGGIGAGGASFTNYTIINAMGAATATGELFSGNYYYAGGGAGYSNTVNGGNSTNNIGGKGGGGGRTGNNNTDGTANTGGGGSFGNTGGSGIIIVRYPV